MISRLLPAAAGLALWMSSVPSAQAQGSLFTAVPVDVSKFILVSAPIGSGERSQLNIYEQRSDKRPCFAVSGSSPAVVDPLLSRFDFTGICNRYIDGNGTIEQGPATEQGPTVEQHTAEDSIIRRLSE